MLIDQIIQNRHLIFDLSNGELRQALLSDHPIRVSRMLENLSESRWLNQLSPAQVTALAEKVVSIVPPDVPDQILDLFLDRIAEKKPPAPNSPFIDTLFQENPLLLKRVLLGSYPLPLPPGKETTEMENLICLEMAFEAHASGATVAYIEQTQSLEATTPAGRDLFTILFYEKNIHLIELALKRHIGLKGVEHVQKMLSCHLHSIYDMLNRGNPETIAHFFELLDQLGLEAAPLVFNPHQEIDLLKSCSNWDLLRLCLKTVSPGNIAQALQMRGKDLIYNFLEDTPEHLEALILFLKNFSIPISPLLLHRGDKDLSAIDAACLNGKKAHLEILLKHIDDDQVIIVIKTTTKEGMRTPLDSCTTIYLDNFDPKQIQSALAELSQQSRKSS